MGQCNSRGQSQAFTLDQLADLQIGQRIEMPKGCGPQIQGTEVGSGYDWLSRRGFDFPRNGEFEYGGLGQTCGMCSDVANGYGCDNCVGSESIVGSRGTVRRVAYGAPAEQCCLQKTKIINNQTCDPRYLNNNNTDPSCDYALGTYCAQPNNRKNPKCIQWQQAVKRRGKMGVEGFYVANDVWPYVCCILIVFLIVWFLSNYKNF